MLTDTVSPQSEHPAISNAVPNNKLTSERLRRERVQTWQDIEKLNAPKATSSEDVTGLGDEDWSELPANHLKQWYVA